MSTVIELGMKNSNFNNATGLPDPENVTSALDLAILTSAIIEDFPDHYKIYSEKTFTYGGITQDHVIDSFGAMTFLMVEKLDIQKMLDIVL